MRVAELRRLGTRNEYTLEKMKTWDKTKTLHFVLEVFIISIYAKINL